MSVVNADNPQVTVALPVFNGGDLLEVSVRSILAQTLREWELLIIDDGSNDGALDQLSCLSDSRIVIVKDGRNRGLASRLNQAVSMARGKYFSRMDHDDICHPDRLMKQLAFLEGHPDVDLLATECVVIDEENSLLGGMPSAISHSAICRRPWLGFYMPHPTWMGRTEWFRRNPYLDPAPYCCEDQELLLRTHRVSCFHTFPERLLAYRVRSHAPLKKIFRTRVAVMRMQVRFFIVKREWGNVLLSTVVAFARIVRDLMRVSLPKNSLREGGWFGSLLSDEEFSKWSSLLRGREKH